MESLGLRVGAPLDPSFNQGFRWAKGASDKFFQLALDGGIADVLLLKDAISVDGEGVRDGMHGKHRCDRAGEAAIAILRPSHLVLGNEVFPFLLVLIETHAKNHQRLTLKFPGDIANMR